MYVELHAGEALRIGLHESGAAFTIDYLSKESGVLSITADMPDPFGREGVIYEERFGDENPDAQLLSAIEHGRDEDVEGTVVAGRFPQQGKQVSHIERDRAEVKAIADMLRAATTREAVQTAYERLGRHIGVVG